MITIEDVENLVEHYKRLELAGIPQPGCDLGPAMLLWSKDREGKEKWEVLPEWVAQLTLSDLSYQGVARAMLYRSPPASAPLSVVAEWTARRLERRRTRNDRSNV